MVLLLCRRLGLLHKGLIVSCGCMVPTVQAVRSAAHFLARAIVFRLLRVVKDEGAFLGCDGNAELVGPSAHWSEALGALEVPHVGQERVVVGVVAIMRAFEVVDQLVKLQP